MVIGNAKKAGVKKFIVPGVDMRSNTDAVRLASIHPSIVYASIGFHPYEAQTIRPETACKELEALLTSSRDSIVAIGECGLDYHLYKNEDATSKKRIQKELFAEQLQLASKIIFQRLSMSGAHMKMFLMYMIPSATLLPELFIVSREAYKKCGLQ